MNQRLLIAGHSHVGCLQRASAKRSDIKVVNVRPLQQEFRKADAIADAISKFNESFNATHICICLTGNQHNVLGILEHPQPFDVGREDIGASTDDDGRHFIPYQTMLDTLRKQTGNSRALGRAIFDRFGTAQRIVLAPPPPIGDWEHISKFPGVFAEKIDLGPAPAPVRSTLYRIFLQALAEMAEDLDASFIAPDERVTTEDGFLKPEFYSPDPTHGNGDYGRIMIDEVFNRMREAA